MIDNDFTIRKLEIFLAFMERQNIARAAETLGISSVSVHRALHSLELTLRCPLFARDGRNLRPLPAAQTLAHHAKETLIRIRCLIDATRETAGFGNGRMKLGCLYSLTTEIVPQLIMGLKRRRPQMEIDLSMNAGRNLLAQLKDNQLDAALMSLPGEKTEMSGLITLPLFEDSFYLAVPLTASPQIREPADLADLQQEKFVTLKDGFATAQQFQDAFEAANYQPTVVTRLNDIFSLMNMVQAGVGYSLVPGRIGKVFANSVKLISLAEKYRKSQTVALVFPKNRERDPDMLALIAEARMIARTTQSPATCPRYINPPSSA